jgi:hypothetical protein
MKKITFFVVLLMLGLQTFSQGVIYGTVKTDGYQKITRGAFWQKRPEAKRIYEGKTVPGFTVYVLESDYFVRFEENEHNSFDRNYIIFPKGEIVYTDPKGNFYAAICGNKIQFLQQVGVVEIVEKTEEQEIGSFEKISTSNNNQNQTKTTEDNDFVPPLTIYEAATMPIPEEYGDEPTVSTPPTFLRRNWPWIVGTAVAVLSGTAYLLLKKGDASMSVDPAGGPFDPTGGLISGK